MVNAVVPTFVLKYIDDNAEKFIDRLRTAISYASISALPQHRPDVFNMVAWTKQLLEKFDVECKIHEFAPKMLHDNETMVSNVNLPPIIFGTLGSDPNKKTVCVYGHLDVQPAVKEDGWKSDPFQLTEIDGKLYGRGSTDDKGPVMAWVNAIESIKNSNVQLPVNLKFCFEAMEESGSQGLEEALIANRDWLENVDYVCISDNYWLGTSRPCLTYGLRGICYFTIEIRCASQDLHSGVHGGAVHEAMSDLIYLMDRLVDKDGKILVPGIYDRVKNVTQDETKAYENIDFTLDEYKRSIGATSLLFENKTDLLMHRWRFPSLSLHGIEGAFSDPGQKTVIPSKVIGKFSIRLVPDQDPIEIERQVIDYLKNLHTTERKSKNSCRICCEQGSKPWVTDFNDPHFKAGSNATKLVYGVEPNMIREGGSIPVALTFQQMTGKNVMLLPLGSGDDMAHSQNEKIDRRNYIQGTKLLTAYLFEVASIQ